MCLLTHLQWPKICDYCWCSGQWWCICKALTCFSAVPFPSPSYQRNLRQSIVINSFSVCNNVGGYAVVQQRVQHFLWQKSGTYYFVRRVPKDIREYYTSSRVVICLKTKRRDRAVEASLSMSLRLSKRDNSALHLLKDKPLSPSKSSSMTLSDALELYLRQTRVWYSREGLRETYSLL